MSEVCEPCAGITALSLLITPFLLQACRHILQDGSGVDTLSALPSVSLPVSDESSQHQSLCDASAYLLWIPVSGCL